MRRPNLPRKEFSLRSRPRAMARAPDLRLVRKESVQMVVAYSTADPAVPAIAASPKRQSLSRTQQALLLLVNAVSDLRDEEDLQCLAFLAGELGILRHTPFYFSRGSASRIPHSVVLDDTLQVSISAGLIGRESGALRAYAAPET